MTEYILSKEESKKLLDFINALSDNANVFKDCINDITIYCNKKEEYTFDGSGD